MVFQEILVNIQSDLSKAGFKQAEKEITNLNKKVGRFNSLFSDVQGFRRGTQQAEQMRDVMEEANVAFRPGENQAPFTDVLTGQPMAAAAAMERLAPAMDRVEAKRRELSKGRMTAQGALGIMAEQLGTMNEMRHQQADRLAESIAQRKGSAEAVKEEGRAMRQSSESTRRFRFESLSLMFGAMALKRAFSRLLSPAFKTAGVFDVISATLERFFLPAAMIALDVVLKLSNFLDSLPQPIKDVINVAALLGLAIGTVATAAFMADLAIQGWMIAASKGGAVAKIHTGLMWALTAAQSAYTAATTAAAGATGTLIAFLTSPIGIIIALGLAIAALAFAWENNLFDIKGVTADVIGFILEKVDFLIEKLNHIPGVDIDTEKLKEVPDKIRESAEKTKDELTFMGVGRSDITGFVGGLFGGGGGPSPRSPPPGGAVNQSGGGAAVGQQVFQFNGTGLEQDRFRMQDVVGGAARRGTERANATR